MRGLLVVVLFFSSLSADAFAQRDPIVLTVESDDQRIDADTLRRQLTEAMDHPVASLGQSENATTFVVVSVERRGPASLIVTRLDEPPRLAQIPRAEGSDWLLAGLVETLRSLTPAEPSTPEATPSRGALMAWSGGFRPRARRNLLRPWPWEEGRAPALSLEQVGGEIGSALAAPAPSGTR